MTQKEIILKAIKNCQKNYSKGFPRWEYQWQEKTSIEKQAEQMAEELFNMGYALQNLNEVYFDVNKESFITTMEGE